MPTTKDITKGESTHTIAVGYNTSKWSMQAAVINPFSSKYDQEVVNLSALAPYRLYAYTTDLSPVFQLNVSFNFDFGKKQNDIHRRINNSDTYTGILSGIR